MRRSRNAIGQRSSRLDPLNVRMFLRARTNSVISNGFVCNCHTCQMLEHIFTKVHRAEYFTPKPTLAGVVCVCNCVGFAWSLWVFHACRCSQVFRFILNNVRSSKFVFKWSLVSRFWSKCRFKQRTKKYKNCWNKINATAQNQQIWKRVHGLWFAYVIFTPFDIQTNVMENVDDPQQNDKTNESTRTNPTNQTDQSNEPNRYVTSA